MANRIELKDFIVQPCKSRLAFEFIPKHKHELDLVHAAVKLKEAGVGIEVETPFLLMLTAGAHGVSLFKSGKLIVKDTQDKETARGVAQRIIDQL
ncbi:MAG: hypothetical protein Q7R47_00760 [Candidatus Diapherotrites archaeon]|nr:hypothetical protein [Candidatus Diapherotrites archaeon]